MKINLYPLATPNTPEEVCSVLDCIFQATHWWNFITPKVALCQFHYDFPPKKFKDLTDESKIEAAYEEEYYGPGGSE